MFGAWVWGRSREYVQIIPAESIERVYSPPRPAIKIDNWVIFPGGCARKLTLRERWQWRRGKLKRVEFRNARMY